MIYANDHLFLKLQLISLLYPFDVALTCEPKKKVFGIPGCAIMPPSDRLGTSEAMSRNETVLFEATVQSLERA